MRSWRQSPTTGPVGVRRNGHPKHATPRQRPNLPSRVRHQACRPRLRTAACAATSRIERGRARAICAPIWLAIPTDDFGQVGKRRVEATCDLSWAIRLCPFPILGKICQFAFCQVCRDWAKFSQDPQRIGPIRPIWAEARGDRRRLPSRARSAFFSGVSRFFLPCSASSHAPPSQACQTMQSMLNGWVTGPRSQHPHAQGRQGAASAWAQTATHVYRQASWCAASLSATTRGPLRPIVRGGGARACAR